MNKLLFIDDAQISSMRDVERRIHPARKYEGNPVVTSDCDWEGAETTLGTVRKEADRYRMWYQSYASAPDPDGIDSFIRSLHLYAESDDGINWEKPDLGIVEFEGSKQNNIYYPTEGFQAINPSVMIDESAPPSERYKMIIQFRGAEKAIFGYTSADGITWEQVSANPIHTEGPFDSHNILIRDDERQRYIIYLRGISTAVPGSFKRGLRAVRRSESEDFLNWTPPELVLESDDGDPPGLHFYTNACVKYARAARAYLMFPMIFYPERNNPSAPYPGLADVQFVASRDGFTWERQFREAFVRPGPDPRNWVDRNPIMGAGIVTPPLTFKGERHELYYSTAGGGSIFVELQEEDGTPIQGLTLGDCNEVFGDNIEGIVSWIGDAGLKVHAGKPVRLRIKLRDASLYAFKFAA